MAAALVAVALAWLVPMGAAHAQTTVSMGRPGDHWASMLAYTRIRRGERNGVYGYKVMFRAEDGCEVELFYPRSTIDFQGQGRTWRNFKVRVKTGWLYYPSRLNATSLPKVHDVILQLEDSYRRQADGAIAAAEGFANVATLGTMTPAPRPAPLPRATRPAPPPTRALRSASGGGSQALVRRGPQYGTHVLKRMAERGITPKMVETTLAKGRPYWDPKNRVINRVLEGGFGSGMDLLVGQNPVTGKITTVIRGKKLVRPRFVPLK